MVSIPTVLALREGKVVAGVTGARNESGYRAMFESLRNGTEVRFQLSALDRALRLAAGALLVVAGISTTRWLVLGIGGIVAFLAVTFNHDIVDGAPPLVRGCRVFFGALDPLGSPDGSGAGS